MATQNWVHDINKLTKLCNNASFITRQFNSIFTQIQNYNYASLKPCNTTLSQFANLDTIVLVSQYNLGIDTLHDMAYTI